MILSAPDHIYGTFDNVEKISLITAKRKIGLHIDATYGGLITPFLTNPDLKIPKIDFKIPGINFKNIFFFFFFRN